jgi:hypothetical protein
MNILDGKNLFVCLQMPSTVNEMETHGFPKSREEHSALYPTVNVLFHNGKLQKWPAA